MTHIIVLGDLNLDVYVRCPDALLRGDEERNPVHTAPGGSAGTFARTAAAEGAKVTFFGAVGRDLAGELLERSLVEAGVRSRLQWVSVATGTVVVLHRGNDRSIICSRGANDGLSPEEIDAEVFAEADHLHISGYAFLSPPQWEAAARAIELARDHGTSISVDPPPANLIERFGVPRFFHLLARVSWLLPNLAEGSLLTDCRDPSSIVDTLAARFQGGALTMGSNGALAWQGRMRHRYKSTPIESIESTGAGDVYAGAFVTAWLARKDLALANRRGCEAARSFLMERSKDFPSSGA